MIAFTDCETLGLDPDRHAIWEAATILWDEATHTEVTRRSWQIEITDEEYASADSTALQIGRYRDRRVPPALRCSKAQFASEFAELTAGVHLAGAVISFDEERLRRLLLAEGHAPAWHYHLIDVESVAVGFLHGVETGAQRVRGGRPRTPPAVARHLPWRSIDLTHHLGIEVSAEMKHTAEGDAEWALALWRACTERPELLTSHRASASSGR